VRPPGILPGGSAGSGRVPLTAHPCADSGSGAIPRAAPAGLFRPLPAAPYGDPVKAARSCAQERSVLPAFVGAHPVRERGIVRSRNRAQGALLQKDAALLLLRAGARRSTGPPSAAVNVGRISPQGRAQEARAFAAGTRMCRQRTPASVHGPSGQEPAGRCCWGAFLFGYFL
jgi:hypothetical protein